MQDATAGNEEWAALNDFITQHCGTGRMDGIPVDPSSMPAHDDALNRRLAAALQRSSPDLKRVHAILELLNAEGVDARIAYGLHASLREALAPEWPPLPSYVEILAGTFG